MPRHKSKVYELTFRHEVHQDPLQICPQPLLLQVIVPSQLQSAGFDLVMVFPSVCLGPSQEPNSHMY